MQKLLAIEWGQLSEGGLLWIGLTYPGDFRLVVQDGRTTKKHLRNFGLRWKRSFGKAIGVWKMEFQERGAPHYHLLLAKPSGMDIKDMQKWVAEAWWEAVGSKDHNHRNVGTHTAEWDDADTPIGYISGYVKSKAHQHIVPDDFDKPGRWWGFWNIKPNWQKVELSPAEWYQVRRAFRKIYKSRNGKSKRGGRGAYTGMWVATRTSDPANLIARLLGRDPFTGK